MLLAKVTVLANVCRLVWKQIRLLIPQSIAISFQIFVDVRRVLNRE